MVSVDGLSVLIVEDEKTTADSLALIFRQKFGASTDTAVNCEEARRLISSNGYGVITLDFQLPDGNGLELLEEIKAQADSPPVIMVTGHGDERTAVEAFRLGASGYVVKDKRMGTLLADAVGHALSTVEFRRVENQLHDIDRKYRLMFENMDEAVGFYSLVTNEAGDPVDFRILEVNDRFLEILDLTREQTIGKLSTEVFGIERPPLLDLFVRMARGERQGVFNFHYEPLQKHFRISAFSPEKDTFVTIFSDISEHHRIQQALKDSEERLREIYDAASEGIAINGPDGRFLFANPRAAEIFGFGSVDEIVGHQIEHPYVNPADRERMNRILLEQGHVEDFEFECRKKDGTGFWVKVNAVMKLDEQGSLLGVTSFIEDVTGRKLMWEALRESEAMLSDIYNSAAEGMAIIDAENRVEYINPKCVQMFGFDGPEALVGLDVFSQEYPNPEIRALFKVLDRDKQVENYDIELRKRDGSLFWGRLNAVLHEDPEGKKRSVVAFVSDITEEKQAYAALAESEARLREIYDSAPEAITVTRPDGTFDYVNPRAAEMFGYESIEEMIGTDVRNVYSDLEFRKQVYDILWEKGFAEGLEGVAVKRDGTEFWGRLNAVLTRDADGNWVRTHFFVTDISEIKNAELALKRTNEELAAYAHSVSHDLKGPLSAIGAMVELLSDSLGRHKERRIDEMLFLLKKNTEIAQDSVDDLLKLAASGQTPSRIENVNLNEVIDRLLTLYSLKIRDKGIRIHVPEDLGIIRANGQQVRQVFSNLISNAIKHNDSDHPEITVTRVDGPEPPKTFLVRDNGSGIPEESFDILFQPFRAAGTTGETGLGLSIARKIAQVYGGDIRAYNDNGACFEVTLNDLE